MMDYTTLKERATKILQLVEQLEGTEKKIIEVNEAYRKAEDALENILDESFAKFEDFSKKKKHAEIQLSKRMQKKITLSDELTLAIANSTDKKVIEDLKQRIKNNDARIENLENAKKEAELRTDNTKPYFFPAADRQKLKEAMAEYDAIDKNKIFRELSSLGLEIAELGIFLHQEGQSIARINSYTHSLNKDSEAIVKKSDFYRCLITDEQRRYFNGYFKDGQLERLLRVIPDDISFVEFAERQIQREKQEEIKRDNKEPLTITTREF